MKTFYVLIDEDTSTHYGYTLDYDKAIQESQRIEKEECIAINIYEFTQEDEIK